MASFDAKTYAELLAVFDKIELGDLADVPPEAVDQAVATAAALLLKAGLQPVDPDYPVASLLLWIILLAIIAVALLLRPTVYPEVLAYNCDAHGLFSAGYFAEPNMWGVVNAPMKALFGIPDGGTATTSNFGELAFGTIVQNKQPGMKDVPSIYSLLSLYKRQVNEQLGVMSHGAAYAGKLDVASYTKIVETSATRWVSAFMNIESNYNLDGVLALLEWKQEQVKKDLAGVGQPAVAVYGVAEGHLNLSAKIVKTTGRGGAVVYSVTADLEPLLLDLALPPTTVAGEAAIQQAIAQGTAVATVDGNQIYSTKWVSLLRLATLMTQSGVAKSMLVEVPVHGDAGPSADGLYGYGFWIGKWLVWAKSKGWAVPDFVFRVGSEMNSKDVNFEELKVAQFKDKTLSEVSQFDFPKGLKNYRARYKTVVAQLRLGAQAGAGSQDVSPYLKFAICPNVATENGVDSGKWQDLKPEEVTALLPPLAYIDYVGIDCYGGFNGRGAEKCAEIAYMALKTAVNAYTNEIPGPDKSEVYKLGLLIGEFGCPLVRSGDWLTLSSNPSKKVASMDRREDSAQGWWFLAFMGGMRAMLLSFAANNGYCPEVAMAHFGVNKQRTEGLLSEYFGAESDVTATDIDGRLAPYLKNFSMVDFWVDLDPYDGVTASPTMVDGSKPPAGTKPAKATYRGLLGAPGPQSKSGLPAGQPANPVWTSTFPADAGSDWTIDGGRNRFAAGCSGTDYNKHKTKLTPVAFADSALQKAWFATMVDDESPFK